MTETGKALKNYRIRLNKTLAQMAAELKVSTTTIVNYETGRRIPDIDFLIAFAEVTGEDFVYWLGLRVAESTAPGAAAAKARLDGIGSYSLAHKPTTTPADKSFVTVPLYNIKNVTGSGAAIDHWRADDAMKFNEAWIRQALGAVPSDLYLVLVDDESMKPTLRSGDTILLDRRATKPDREGIYLILMDGVLLIKRLQALPGGIIKVVSDNPAYEAFTLRLAEIREQNFAILGRVVWVMWAGRKM